MSKTPDKFWLLLVIATVLIAGCIGAPQQRIEPAVTAPPETAMPEVTEAPAEEMEKAPEVAAPAVTIELVDVPTSAVVGHDIRVSWRVIGGDLRATHSAVHYDYESKPGMFGLDIGPAASGYPSLTKDFVSGDFALPMDFSVAFEPDKAGTIYFRAHAIVGGKNYWTDERSVVVKDVPSVEITSIPEKVAQGDVIKVTWMVKGQGLKATHTALHYGKESKAGAFGLDVGPAASGYPSLTAGFLSGEYALPMEFNGEIKAEEAGIIYLRAHAIVDGKHYWTAEKMIEVLQGPGVTLTSLPSKVIVGTDLKISWRVLGDGLTATHTAIHYGYVSKQGTFDLDVGPSAAGYPSLTSEFASGNFALPMDFSTAFKPSAAGTLYLRVHATIGGKHYWTDEKSVTVASLSGGGGYSYSTGSMGGSSGGGYY